MTPEISIIIPMYNVEKFIGECLDSIFAQTFIDYEVIVVDDCSTDKSCAIVESYMSTFNKGGKEILRLIVSEKNAGSPGTPRNKGIALARGKYIYFVDSDDAIVETALEELYTVAEDFQADVVHTEKFYRTKDDQISTDKNHLTIECIFPDTKFATKPTLMSKDIKERIELFVSKKFDWSTCHNFIRRNFVVENKLQFPLIKNFEDGVLTLCILCLAEKIVCVPNTVYVYRKRQGSLSHHGKSSSKIIIEQFGGLFFRGFSMLDKFFTERKIFEDEPIYRFKILRFLADWQLPAISGEYGSTPLNVADEIVRDELKKVDDLLAPAAFFFDYMNLLLLESYQKQATISKWVNENNKLQEFAKTLIKILYRSNVETQNLKAVLDAEKARAFLEFNDAE